MKHRKYVVIKDGPGEWGVALGYVEFHRDLCETEEIAHGLVDGGGLWDVDHNDKKIKFYGKSDDFGYPKDIEGALSSCYVGIKQQVSEILETFGENHEVNDYEICYVDELGVSHTVTQRITAAQHDYILRNYMNNGYFTNMPSYKTSGIPKVKPKNYDKKKKAKRKAQKQSRRHK